MNLAQLAAKAYDHQNRLDYLANAQPIAAWKTALTGRSSSTRTADPDLSVTLEASTVYEVRAMFMYYSATAGTGFNFGFSPTGGGGNCGGSYGLTVNIGGAGMLNQGFTWDQVPGCGTPAGQNSGVVLAGIMITPSNGAGPCYIAWGNGDNTHTTNLNKGSYICFTRLAAA